MDRSLIHPFRKPDRRLSRSGDARRSAQRLSAAIEAMEHRLCLAADLSAAAHYSAGSAIDFIDHADFNADGKRDLIVSSYASSRVSILLGNGDGTFQSPSHIALTARPDHVVVGDVNSDGKADLITTSYDSNTISVLLGNGNGTFQTQADYAAGAGPRMVALGDFTGDGKLDLIVAKSYTKTITLLKNNGDGTFQSPLNATVSFTPVDIFAGDFNGDGTLDIAAADFFTDKVAIALGNGNGTFATATQYSTGAGPASITAGDFNGDGKLDVATANFYGNTLSVLRGNGNGTMQTATTLTAGSGATYVMSADVDGNGSMDLVAANANNDTVSLFFNNGSGTFSSAASYGVGDSPRSLVVANFNGGGLDLAVANQGSSNFSVLLGNGSAFPPTADAGTSYTVAEGGTVQLSGLGSTGSDLTYLWDLDGDGVYGEYGSAAKRGDEIGATPVFSGVGIDGPDTRTVRLRVTDANGLSDNASVVITVTNTAPTLNISGSATATVGATYTLNLSASDPGVDTVSGWAINWGDGTSSTVGNVSSATKSYASAGSFTITATATDEDGTYSSNSRGVSVYAAPVSNPGGPYNVSEGGTVQLSGTSSTGTGLSYTWDLDGDGVFGETGSGAKRGDETGAIPVFSAVGLDGLDSRTARLRITDINGVAVTASAVVWIQNVAPTLAVNGSGSVLVGGSYMLTLAASDPGIDTISGWSIDWGDGSSSAVGAVPSAVKVYSMQGKYSIVASATDEDGTYAAAAVSVTVIAVPDTTAPTAALAAISPVTVAGDGGTDFTVTYSDNVALNPATFDGDDILVTGPNDYSGFAGVVGVSGGVVTYRVAAPGGSWDVADNGTYTVSLRAAQVADASDNYAVAGVLGTFTVSMTVPDSAGNTLDTARSFGTLSTGMVKVAEDGVGAADKNDFFKFTLGSSASVSIKLSNLADKADLYLLDSTGATIVASKRAGAADENIIKTLAKGTYYIRGVYSGSSGFTAYRLRTEVMAAGVVDPGINTAIDTGGLGNGAIKAYTGGVTASGAYYKFSLASAAQVYAKLTELTANADLQILDSVGNVLATSKKTGTSDEGIRMTLAAGTYYVKIVLKATTNTNYRLRLANETA